MTITPQSTRKSGIDGIVWPPVLVGDGAVLSALVARLEETQWLAPAALEDAQGQQLVRLAAHHARHSPSFAARVKASGVGLSSLDHPGRLRSVEPIGRRHLQALGDGFFSKVVPEGHLPSGETTTSGSTGEPVRVRRTAMSRLFWAAFSVRDHLWHARDFAGRMTSIRPTIPAYVEADNGGFPVADLFRTGKAQGLPSDLDIDKQLALIDRFQPETLLIFPTNLQAFVSAWEKSGAMAPGSIKHIRTVGETVSAGLRERLAKISGLGIEDSYSSQELGVIAIECLVSGLYHVMSESVIVEILDDGNRPCREWEVGRVVVTELQNFASPLVRYDIGDYAEVRSLPTLRRILGRERNLLVKPDGTRHWPLVGLHRFDDVAPVLQYQVIRHSLQDMEIKIVTTNEISSSQERALAAIVQHALGYPSAIRVTQSRTRLPHSTGGKFEEFVSELRPP